VAECISERGVRQIVEAGCGNRIGSLAMDSSSWLGLGRVGCDSTLRGRLFSNIIYPMKGSIGNIGKKRGRGRPPVGAIPVLVRLLPEQLASLDRWRGAQVDSPGRPEAIRRLVELAFARAPSIRSVKAGSRRKAAEMAGRTIDQLGDQTATDEQRAHRKRRLIKGPREFRDARSDQPKRKA
jgi:hypothetical protein